MFKHATGLMFSLMSMGPVFAGAPQLHPLEQYCVIRDTTGMMKGQTVECSCEWGHRRYEIQDISMKVGTMTIPNRQHLIQVGPEITIFNPDTRHGTVSQVPNYAEYLNSAADQGAMDNMRKMMESMGSVFTDETREIAGEECTVVTSPGMGDMCISGDGIVLKLVVTGGTMTQVAISLDKSTCGDMANYEVPADVVIGDAPDMSSILEQLEQMQQGTQGE